MATIRDKKLVGAEPQIINGTSVYYDKETKTYNIFTGNDKTHDNILISCTNLDILIHVLNSINYGNINEKVNVSKSNVVGSSSTKNKEKNKSEWDYAPRDGVDYDSSKMSYENMNLV